VPVVVKAEHREAILRDERLCDRQEGITFEGGEIVVALGTWVREIMGPCR